MTELLKEYLHSRQSNHRDVIYKVSLLYVKRLLQYASAGQLHSAPEEKAEDGFEEQRNAKFLTAKELDVLRQIHEGMSNKEIADYMRISLSTVKTHVNNLYKKLGVSNRVLAVEQAKRQGVI
ncbi:putative transcriptional regulatory protein NarL [compost metagenome]